MARTEEAEPDPVIGYLLQAPADAGQRLLRRSCEVCVQHQRIRGAEPADGTREIHTCQDLFPSVPLEVHPYPPVPTPCRKRARQCREQYLEERPPQDLCRAVHESRRLSLGEIVARCPRRYDGVPCLTEVHRERVDRCLHGRAPVLQLPLEP